MGFCDLSCFKMALLARQGPTRPDFWSAFYRSFELIVTSCKQEEVVLLCGEGVVSYLLDLFLKRECEYRGKKEIYGMINGSQLYQGQN